MGKGAGNETLERHARRPTWADVFSAFPRGQGQDGGPLVFSPHLIHFKEGRRDVDVIETVFVEVMFPIEQRSAVGRDVPV